MQVTYMHNILGIINLISTSSGKNIWKNVQHSLIRKRISATLLFFIFQFRHFEGQFEVSIIHSNLSIIHFKLSNIHFNLSIKHFKTVDYTV